MMSSLILVHNSLMLALDPGSLLKKQGKERACDQGLKNLMQEWLIDVCKNILWGLFIDVQRGVLCRN